MKTTLSILSLLLVSITLIAQPANKGKGGGGMQGPPEFRESFFSPRMIIRHANDIGITNAQKKAILAEMNASQAEHNRLRWNLKEEADKLKALIDGENVDVNQAKDQLSKVLALENELKILQLTSMLTIKNKLSAEQQAKLKTLRPEPSSRGKKGKGMHGDRSGRRGNR